MATLRTARNPEATVTRHQYMHAYHPHHADAVEAACEEPGRARRRDDLPADAFLGGSTSLEFGDREEAARSGGIVRPDHRAPVRRGHRPQRWLADYVYLGM